LLIRTLSIITEPEPTLSEYRCRFVPVRNWRERSSAVVPAAKTCGGDGTGTPKNLDNFSTSCLDYSVLFFVSARRTSAYG